MQDASAASPSRWRRRRPIAALALAGCAIASYLAAFQYGLIAGVWDPVFGDGSRAVLTSSLDRLLPLHDALLGAIAYALEAVLDLSGGSDRWRSRPWLVLVFGLVTASLALTALTLVLVQAFVVRAFCLLCLGSAAISLVIAALAWEELGATLVFVTGRHTLGPSRKESNMNEHTPERTNGVPGNQETQWRGPDLSTNAPDGTGVVVVTGAAAGLGRAIVREFAKHGYDVGLIARSQEALEAAKTEVESCGRRALVCAIDVADADAVERAAGEIEDQLGPIDIWVNDAMVSVFSPVKEMRPEEYRRVAEVNYLGYVHGSLAALKRMLPRDKGTIVHVGSALAYRSIPLQSAYCASKHAILGFHESLLTELIHDGSHVRSTMVQMPALNTPQFGWVKSRLPNKPQPVPPIFQPEVGAEAVYWAAHNNRREVLVGFSTWLAVNANKLVPALLDRYLGKTGYQSQQTDQPEEPGRRDDVWQPVPGDRGARGVFDSTSADKSLELTVTTHRSALVAVAAVASLAVFSLWRMASNGRSH